MKPFSSLRVRLVVAVFAAIAPVGVVMYLFNVPWMGFMMGWLALWAVWYGGEHFVLRQVRDILGAAKRLAEGELGSRTQVGETDGEIGELAGAFDRMAASIELRSKQSQAAERAMLNRAQQQGAVAMVGQFALVSQDFTSLLNQAVTMAAETLEVEFAHALTQPPEGETLLLQAGVGWKSGAVGSLLPETQREFLPGYVMACGEPVVVTDCRSERRFKLPGVMLDHEIQNGVVVALATRARPFGVLGVYCRKPRNYTGDEVNFLVALATSLGLAAERFRGDMESQRLAAFAQLNPNPVFELAADGEVTYFNEAALKLSQSLNCGHPRALLPPNVAAIIGNCLQQEQGITRQETKLGGRTLSWFFHAVPESLVVHCYVEDVSDRLNLEAQLRQAQKMESVGQLAAGIAHDFNNMLTIIQGHAGLLLAKAAGSKPQADSSQAIYFAAERAAALTRQLLVFSRKNVIQRKQLDLRDVMGNMTKMLRRLLGETVELQFTSAPKPALVNGDTGMIEQVLMNLVVNARDAMPKGGTVTISLEPREIAASYVEKNPQARVGHFVCLCVADTGTGMDSGTISRIFEPFFTTKEVGKGTGLGLATVYGIVNQHAGWIEVTSEVGRGSKFSVFLPANAEPVVPISTDSDPVAFVSGGKETILIVEDEPMIRDMALTILNEKGYRTYSAGSGREAVELWEQERGKIDLLLTDMVMPGRMSGVELASTLLPQQPQLKVIFASGYTVDDVSEEFLQKNNAIFLQKPYTRQALSHAVRQALDKAKESSPVSAVLG